MTKKILVIFICLFLMPFSAQCLAATHYIRAGASGSDDGSDWTNAFPTFPTALTRGDTYYVADGSYGDIVLDDDEHYAGTSYITVKKATAEDHGTATGWDSGYGDGAAIFSQVRVASHYYILDGQIGSGKTGYGFEIDPISCESATADYNSMFIQGLYDPYGIHHVEVRHFDISGLTDACHIAETNVYCSFPIVASRGEISNITVANCYLHHGSSNMKIRYWNGGVIENNYFYDNWSNSNCHGQQISPGLGCNDVILRNNTFEDSSTFVVGAHTDNNYRWKIYNNIVIGGSLTACWANADSGTSDVMKDWEIHNNTYDNVDFGGRGAVFIGTLTDVNGDKSFAYNNLFYDCVDPQMNNSTGYSEGAIVHDNNAYLSCTGTINSADESDPVRIDSTTSPFQSGTYYLLSGSAPIDEGKSLDSAFALDVNSVSRPQGSAWDIGACEYATSSSVGKLKSVSNVRLSIGGVELSIE